MKQAVLSVLAALINLYYILDFLVLSLYALMDF
jgi:hypothetical protein